MLIGASSDVGRIFPFQVSTFPELRGHGFASTLMAAACRDADVATETLESPRLVYLSTSSPANVSFYRRFGFEVQ